VAVRSIDKCIKNKFPYIIKQSLHKPDVIAYTAANTNPFIVMEKKEREILKLDP